jgi:hypothetical protein
MIKRRTREETACFCSQGGRVHGTTAPGGETTETPPPSINYRVFAAVSRSQRRRAPMSAAGMGCNAVLGAISCMHRLADPLPLVWVVWFPYLVPTPGLSGLSAADICRKDEIAVRQSCRTAGDRLETHRPDVARARSVAIFDRALRAAVFRGRERLAVVGAWAARTRRRKAADQMAFFEIVPGQSDLVCGGGCQPLPLPTTDKRKILSHSTKTLSVRDQLERTVSALQAPSRAFAGFLGATIWGGPSKRRLRTATDSRFERSSIGRGPSSNQPVRDLPERPSPCW